MKYSFETLINIRAPLFTLNEARAKPKAARTADHQITKASHGRKSRRVEYSTTSWGNYIFLEHFVMNAIFKEKFTILLKIKKYRNYRYEWEKHVDRQKIIRDLMRNISKS